MQHITGPWTRSSRRNGMGRSLMNTPTHSKVDWLIYTPLIAIFVSALLCMSSQNGNSLKFNHSPQGVVVGAVAFSTNGIDNLAGLACHRQRAPHGVGRSCMRTSRVLKRSPFYEIRIRGGGISQIQKTGNQWHVIAASSDSGVDDINESTATPTSVTSPPSTIPSKKTKMLIGYSVSALLLSLFLYNKRGVWLPMMKKENIQATTLSLLHKLQPDDPNDILALARALLLYVCGMAFWEVLGMSTIPVETAAGMVFGWKGAVASLSGKLLGASIAFGAGRTFLSSTISQSSLLRNNAVFQLLNDSAQKNQDNSDLDGPNAEIRSVASPRTPLQTAFLMKFSCFPEFIKNFGSSLLPVIRPWMFILATVVHGGTFTFLWTWLGVDTAARLAITDLPVNRELQVALVVAGFIGLVLTPIVMAWWIRDLRKAAVASQATKPLTN